MPPSSEGSWFQFLQATSHALQPMQIVVSVKKPMGSWRGGRVDWIAIMSRPFHVAHERFAFMDRHVGVADPGSQIVDDVADREPRPAPVPRHADVMNALAGDL